MLTTFHEIKDLVSEVVVTASLLHTFLPPWDAEPLEPFPGFVKYYKVIIYLVGYIGLNGRSTVYKNISIEKVGGINEKRDIR